MERAEVGQSLTRPSCCPRVPQVTVNIGVALKVDRPCLSREIKSLAVGDRPGRSTSVKQMEQRYARPHFETELETYRRSLTSLAIKALVAVMDYVNDVGDGFVRQANKNHAEVVQEFAEFCGPEWTVPVAVAASVKNIWITDILSKPIPSCSNTDRLLEE